MSTALPAWMYPPREGGWEADDLDLLPPDAPRHIELLDGALIFNTSPERSWHDRVIRRLTAALEVGMPAGWTVEAQMTDIVEQAAKQSGEPCAVPDRGH